MKTLDSRFTLFDKQLLLAQTESAEWSVLSLMSKQ